MIRNFGHRGLKRLYEQGDTSRINPEHLTRIEDILAKLDVATQPGDMNLPGYRLHALKRDRKGQWAVVIRANWRVTFRFKGNNVCDVNYEDYH